MVQVLHCLPIWTGVGPPQLPVSGGSASQPPQLPKQPVARTPSWQSYSTPRQAHGCLPTHSSPSQPSRVGLGEEQ